MPERTGQRVWMLLEDDEFIRVAMTDVIETWDIVPLVFEDGSQAMDWLDRVEAGRWEGTLPELGLLDTRLPSGPQGDDVAQRIRSLPQTANMTLVIMTAYALSQQDRERIEQKARPDLVLEKPFAELAELRETLESALRRRRGGQ